DMRRRAHALRDRGVHEGRGTSGGPDLRARLDAHLALDVELRLRAVPGDVDLRAASHGDLAQHHRQLAERTTTATREDLGEDVGLRRAGVLVDEKDDRLA